MPKIQAQPEEKRNFYRYDMQVSLEHRVVDKDLVYTDENYEKAYEYFSGGRGILPFEVMAALHENDNTLAKLQRSLARSNPEFARYLKLMDNKISLLAKLNFAQLATAHKRINLSAGGLAFFNDEPINIDSNLLIKLILLPDYYGIISYARVVSCMAFNGDSHGDEIVYRISI